MCVLAAADMIRSDTYAKSTQALSFVKRLSSCCLQQLLTGAGVGSWAGISHVTCLCAIIICAAGV